jgi:hypothetical protein
MPVHDWTRVDAGTFHDVHTSWIVHLKDTLNAGVLPKGYYAMTEQVVSGRRTDVLALHPSGRTTKPTGGGLVVTEAKPTTRERARPVRRIASETPRRRRIVIRHVSDKRVVSVIEIVSPANKDRRESVEELAGKIAEFLESGVQVLVIDLFPRGRHDPRGVHGAVWSRYDRERYPAPRR